MLRDAQVQRWVQQRAVELNLRPIVGTYHNSTPMNVLGQAVYVCYALLSLYVYVCSLYTTV